jgi:Ran GTPase-activating protein (RanGAP) involved in mRNA processing and transport
MVILHKELSSRKHPCGLVALNLRSTYLKPKQIGLLADALKTNNTLVKLDLSYNGMNSLCGIFIMRAMTKNQTLHILNLEQNELEDEFVYFMIDVLRGNALGPDETRNITLHEINLSGNPFSTFAAHALYSAITSTQIVTRSFGSLN